MSETPQTYSILGAARSGLAVARLLRREGAYVFVSDAKPAESCDDARRMLESIGADYEFGGHTARVLESTALVLSPGVPDTLPIVRQAREHGLEITNEIEIAARRCRAPIVAITGTNGKTTTSELTGFIFRSSGMNTYVAGNVGLPFSEIVADADERSVVVLEVSSFQLEHISTFRPRVAVLLNVTPDHLDRYGSFEEYVRTKFRITMNQTSDDTLIYNRDDHNLSTLPEQSMARAIGFSLAQELPFGAFARDGMLILRDPTSGTEEGLMQTQEIRIRGPHNLYNSMAAALAARTLGVGFADIRNSLRNFPGVPHRLEPVRELDGVRYVNDSKATNVDSLWYALSSFFEPIVLIAGGKGKKNNYEPVLPLIDERVRAVVLVGDEAAEMEKAFSNHTMVVRAGYDMDMAVQKAQSLAKSGDVVLLSPACASFDMFDNYEHRGEVFKSLVHRLHTSSAEAHTGESIGGHDKQ